MARIRAAGADVWTDQSSGGSSAATPLRYASAWKLDGSTDQQDVTAFGDSNLVFIAGLPNASGSIDGFYDDTTTTGSTALFTMAQSGVARKTYFYAKAPSTSGPYWHGLANFGVSYDFNVKNPGQFSMNWSAGSSFYAVG